jgi:hypothetical protein
MNDPRTCHEISGRISETIDVLVGGEDYLLSMENSHDPESALKPPGEEFGTFHLEPTRGLVSLPRNTLVCSYAAVEVI